MKKVKYDSIEDLVDETLNDMEESKYETISYIAKYDDAKGIIYSLINQGLEISAIDIEPEDYSNYHDEYSIGIYGNEIFCEKMKKESGYINDESDKTYLLDNCSSKVIPNIAHPVEVSVEEEDLECDNLLELSEDLSCNGIHTYTNSYTDKDGIFHSYSISSTDKDIMKEFKCLWD